MATDADVPRAEASGAGSERDHAAPARDGRTDCQSVGESVERTPERSDPPVGPTPGRTPETLYLTRIAVLEARVAALEATVARKECDLQHVIDRYEHVLDGRDARRDEPLVDLARETTDTGIDDDTGIDIDGGSGDADDPGDDVDPAGADADAACDDTSSDDPGRFERVRALFR